MTPEITIRTFTDDQYQLDKVFYANNYRLKQLPEKEKVTVVDVGAHTGTFSLLCLMRGANKVYAIEPFSDNFRVLSKNLEAFVDRVDLMGVGVYTETRFAKLSYPKNEKNFFYLADIKLHSEGDDVPSELSYLLTLDELLDGVTEPEVDILKIHIGYAETDILMSSERIDKCNYVCGETTAPPDKIQELIRHMTEKGFKDSFLAESKEKENCHLILFAKEKVEDLFNLYVAGSPEEAEANEAMAKSMTPLEGVTPSEIVAASHQ